MSRSLAGRAALAAAFDIHPVPDRARFVSEVGAPVSRPAGSPSRRHRESLRAAAPAAAASGRRTEAGSGSADRGGVERRGLPARRGAGDLVVAILGDRQAALLCLRLAGLDDETLQYLAEHPALLTQLYALGAEPFAVFASSVHVQGGRVVPPGGDEAVPLWEAVVGEQRHAAGSISSPRCSRAPKAGWRSLYDTIGQLDPRAAALRARPVDDRSAARLERMQALAAASSRRPTWRAMKDAAVRAPAVRPGRRC